MGGFWGHQFIKIIDDRGFTLQILRIDDFTTYPWDPSLVESGDRPGLIRVAQLFGILICQDLVRYSHFRSWTLSGGIYCKCLWSNGIDWQCPLITYTLFAWLQDKPKHNQNRREIPYGSWKGSCVAFKMSLVWAFLVSWRFYGSKTYV